MPYIVFSARATGETQPKEGLVRNAASPGPGVSGQGGAGDGRWSPISVQAVERNSFGSGVAARGHPTEKDPAERRGQLDRNVSCSMTGVALRLSEDGSMG